VLRVSKGTRFTLVDVGQNILLLLVSRPTILLLNILFQVFALFLSMKLERHHVQFFTAVCNDWLLLLESDEAKDIVVNALHYQVKVGHVKIAAFVIMPNHLHLIWRIQNECRLEDVQRDFLKFTARELLRLIETKKGATGVEELFVGLKDRAFQVWKRNSMSIDLVHEWFFKQKFEYLHNNPCQPHWQLATLSEDYKYSSASFYDTGEDRFGFLTHHSEI
jgi:REP element-mobilizing transposase RayT